MTTQKSEIQQALDTIWEAIKKDILYFVREFVYIEDPQTDGLVMKFDPWPAQVEALNVFQDHRLVVVLKARQLGLSWLALIYTVWRMLTRSGFRATGLSRGENEAKELVRRIKFILRYLPDFLIRPAEDAAGWNGLTWEGGVMGVTIKHPGKEDSSFNCFPAAPDSGRSFTSSLVVLDEWAFQQFARRIWQAAYPTINRPTGGQVIGISSGQRNTFFEEIWNGAVSGTNSFYPLFLSWRADPSRDDEWYEETKKNLPHTYRQEYPETPEDAFAAGEGAAFYEWDPKIHVPFDADWYPPPDWRIVRAYDGGLARACCKWYAISPDGDAVCYREFYPKNMTDDDQAQEIKRLSKCPDGSSEEIAYTVADPSCWSKQAGTGESTADVFARYGVPMRKADNDRINGWKRLHQWLKPREGKPSRLTFTKACVNTIRTYPTITVDENRPDDINTRQEDHPQDCDRYFVMSRPAAPRRPKEEEEMRRRRSRRIRPFISPITGY